MPFTSSRTRRYAAALFTMVGCGLPLTGHADVVLQEKPSDSFSLADGSVRNGKIVGDKLFIVGVGGKLVPAPDGVYTRDGKSLKVERGVIVSGGGGRPADPVAQKGIVVQQKGK